MHQQIYIAKSLLRVFWGAEEFPMRFFDSYFRGGIIFIWHHDQFPTVVKILEEVFPQVD